MNKTIKGACLVAATALLPLSQAAMAGEVNISGWINEGMTYYDDGVGSDLVQVSDNGTTLGSRITFSGTQELPNSGLTAGFEVILEPKANNTPLIFSNQSESVGLPPNATRGPFSDSTGHDITVLGNSINIGGSFGKLTVGLQSMPTDNIAVLEDPSLTLWSSISPVFRANGFTIQGLGAGAGNTVWGDFMNCLGTPGLRGIGGIGIDCNGIYRQGVRYDLPAFGPVTVAIGYANDDVYDISAKYKGDMGGLKSQLAIGYSINQDAGTGGSEAQTFQLQGGLMDPGTGIFGTMAYQMEDMDANAGVLDANHGDSTDAWWLKVGIKKAFNTLGDTSIAFQYGSYNDQYFDTGASNITGSEVTRMGFEINQYFGSGFILYGVWEQLDLDVSCVNAAMCNAHYGQAEELNTFTAGMTYFF